MLKFFSNPRSGSTRGLLRKFNDYLPCPKIHLWYNFREDIISSFYMKSLTIGHTKNKIAQRWRDSRNLRRVATWPWPLTPCSWKSNTFFPGPVSMCVKFGEDCCWIVACRTATDKYDRETQLTNLLAELFISWNFSKQQTAGNNLFGRGMYVLTTYTHKVQGTWI